MKKTLVSLLLLAGFCVSAADTVIVNLHGTSEIGKETFNGYNTQLAGGEWRASQAGYALVLGENTSITLDAAQAENGVFTLYANILATNGGFTVTAETGIDEIRWIGSLDCPEGTVTVNGATKIVFGDVDRGSGYMDTNFSFFEADVEFSADDADGMVFTNGVTCAKPPSSCDWTIAKDARFCVNGPGVLSGENDTYEFTSFNLTVLTGNGISAGQITVGAERQLVFRQCSATVMGTTGSRAGIWAWAGAAQRHLTNSVHLADESSQLMVCGAQRGATIDGAVTGEGSVMAFPSASKNNDVHFDGSVDVSRFYFGYGMTKTDLTAYFNKKEGTIISLGAVTVEFEEGSDAVCSIAEISGQTIEMDSLSGPLTVSGDATGTVVIGKLLEDAELTVDGSVKVQVLDCDPAATVTLRNPGTEGWHLSGSEENVTVLTNLTVETEGASLSFGGKALLGALGGKFGSISLGSGSELFATFDSGTEISGTGGKIVTDWTFSGEVVTSRTWKEKVVLWTDSSAENAFCFPTNEFTTIENPFHSGYAFISQWNDWRPDATHCFRQVRYSTNNPSTTVSTTVYPLLDDDLTLNGHPTVSMWHNDNSSSRRINIAKVTDVNHYSPVKTEYAIMVFGAQSGGGGALLGTADGYFARKKSYDRYNKGNMADNPISSNNVFTVHLNGGPAANSTEIGLSNGWQIVSMDAMGRDVNGLGAAILRNGNGGTAQADSPAGFQRYAEVMLFSEEPTEAERMIAEEYLAEKWGLPCAHSGTGIPVELTVTPGDSPSETPIINLAGDDVPRSVTVNVEFPERHPEKGRYALVGGFTAASCSFGTVNGAGGPIEGVKLVYDEEARILYAEVVGRGIRIIVR